VLIYGCIVREFFGRKAGVEIEGERLRPSVACAGEAPLRRITPSSRSAPPLRSGAQPPFLSGNIRALPSFFPSCGSAPGRKIRRRAPHRNSGKLLASLATSATQNVMRHAPIVEAAIRGRRDCRICDVGLLWG
jgi:hypothetical protein